jgi:hypothetical protein
MGLLGIELDTLDVFIAVILLIVTSGFVNALLQYFHLNVCQDARLFQAGVLFLLALIFNSPFTVILSIIELVIGITDYLAVSNSEFAWLDPNLA